MSIPQFLHKASVNAQSDPAGAYCSESRDSRSTLVPHNDRKLAARGLLARRTSASGRATVFETTDICASSWPFRAPQVHRPPSRSLGFRIGLNMSDREPVRRLGSSKDSCLPVATETELSCPRQIP